MFFDAVIDRDMQPLYNDTPEKVEEWLLLHGEQWKNFRVVAGKTMKILSVEEYIAEADRIRERI